MNYIFLILFCLLYSVAGAQHTIRGVVRDESGKPVTGAIVFVKTTALSDSTDVQGNYELKNIPSGSHTVACFLTEKKTTEKQINLTADQSLDFVLYELTNTLKEVMVEGKSETDGLARLSAIENFGINEAKKNEVIVLRDITINTATNNARQLYSKITGLNIWESDQAGIQLGIGGRGLSPNRTANFNTRQNGYDISADALGYPESYYTPPAEALEKIEIIRGAASLQYGTQFGGMVNFRFRKGPHLKKIELTSRQSIGSWNYFSSFNSLGGTVAKGKLNYYVYYNYKRGDGYRPNSNFNFHNAYASFDVKVSDKFEVNLEFTKMTYLARQAGGLTDKLFQDNPRQSVRSRNWFRVDWNLLAINVTYRFNEKTQLNVRNFGLLAGRKSLGNLERINVADFGNNRTLIDGEFKNFGNETRLIHRYTIKKHSNAFVAGFRFYRGETTARQGDGNDQDGPDFEYLNPSDLENSDYQFPNYNYAAFVENIFDLSPKLSVTPGVRFENIQTFSSGYYKQYVFDGAGNIIVENILEEDLNRKRSFILAGIGISYKPKQTLELYGNISQNYRAINFTDLRIVNPNFVVDSNIQDEKGFTADLGIRGSARPKLNYEVTVFYLSYKDKIGQVLRADQPPLFNDYRFRGNISDARTIGVEAFAEYALSKMEIRKPLWTVFVNTSITDARYINSDDASIQGKQVEQVPPFILRSGSTIKFKPFSFTAQYSYSSKHFTDATNAVRTATAIEGIIPAYHVVDLSASYAWKKFTFETSCNNLLNEKYFTRRADSYPGPGIIPADGRGLYVTVQIKL
jgi:Fe(3+) dicitrate transport protein